MPAASFTADAVLTVPSFTAQAWLAGTTLLKHDRHQDHYGTETDTAVELAAAIGPYPAGTTLDVFLSGLWGTLAAMGATNGRVAAFTADAVLAGGTFTVDAALLAATTATLTADARIATGGVASFTAEARIVREPGTLTVTAYLIDYVPG